MDVKVLLEEEFYGHQGTEMYDPERAHYRHFCVRRQTTLTEFIDLLAENFKYPRARLRPWPFKEVKSS